MSRLLPNEVEEFVTGLGTFIGLILAVLAPILILGVWWPVFSGMAIVAASLLSGCLWVVVSWVTRGVAAQIAAFVVIIPTVGGFLAVLLASYFLWNLPGAIWRYVTGGVSKSL